MSSPRNDLIPLELFTVDSFTKSPFRGNPAAVCFLTDENLVAQLDERFPSDLDKENLYKLIAREMNLSETCFLRRSLSSSLNDQDGRFQLRWFTPTVEVNLCGHATLAAAHLIFSKFNENSPKRLVFETRSGELSVEKDENDSELLKLNFPAGDPQRVQFPTSVMLNLLKHLNLLSTNDHDMNTAEEKIASIVKETILCRKTKKLLLVVKDLRQVLQVEPNESALLAMNFESEDLQNHVKGVAVNMPVNEMDEESKMELKKLVGNDVEVDKIDFVTRYFSPWNGIKEDPVNGSSQTSLCPYYSNKLGKQKLVCFQASKRSGILFAEPISGGRVSIGGYAKTMMTAKMFI
ncbi:hypothetical protein C9374_009460 [Naegleria lovaniensis]|uniref:Phenazine biosynthesis-like domain-containing protein n=1 Tax=Naegleria lovaniensis TaxID=51637 RepID=A0AA88GXK8_NAELO|nr:uncharacterized protein C9374_009460 [Naegleria lovaniensis]KAG2392883.1 hypothetical protein C9374_009460 [Naegleria lovaniensis]